MSNIGRNSGRFNRSDPADDRTTMLDLWRESPPRRQARVEPNAVWLFLRRNLVRMAVVSALASALALLAAYFVFNKYAATAVILVDPRSAKITQTGGVLANIGSDAIAIESIAQVARSESFLGALVDQLNLTQDDYFSKKGANKETARFAAIEKLGAKLTIARRGTTYVIDVIASTPSPERSARIANAAAQMIVDDQSRLRTGANSTTAREIESRLVELRGKVGRAEERAAELKTKLKVTGAGQGSTLLERRVFELNQQVVLAGAKTAEARARYELLRKSGASAGENLPPTVQSTVLNALRAENARLTRQAADQATVLGPRHPEVASLRAQIADVHRQITGEIGRLMGAARSEYLESEQREAEAARQLKDAQTESGRLGPELVKLSELDREATAERAVYEQLLNRQRELTQIKDLDPSDIRIVSPALPPTRTTPPLSTTALASVAIGLLTGLLCAVFREWLGSTLMTATQAQRMGDIDVLGFIPLLTRPEKAKDIEYTPDLTPWLADLCAEISTEPTSPQGVVILIASARRGEGRSTVAVNVAAYLSEGGDRVLLIEADRPTELTKPRFGLLDILESGEDLQSALVEPTDFGYTQLPFGGRTLADHNNVGGLMSGMTLRAALKLARNWFDVVVIDGPPALSSAYAPFLSSQADYTVFLVEWDKTRTTDANAAFDRLDLAEAAVVYNKVDPNRLRLYDPERSRQMVDRQEEIELAA